MSRLETLKQRAYAFFHGCEVCTPSLAGPLLEGVLEEADINAADRMRLNGRLRCPHCDSRLYLLDEVAPYEQSERMNLRRSRLCDRYVPEVLKLEQVLTRSHRVGNKLSIARKIRAAIRTASVTEIAPRTWFRLIGKSRFNEDLFWDNRASKAGRYNRIGEYCFYLADTAKAAILECIKEAKHDRGHEGWIADVTVRSPLRVLDVRIPFLSDAPKDELLAHLLRFTNVLRRPTDLDNARPDTYTIS